MGNLSVKGVIFGEATIFEEQVEDQTDGILGLSLPELDFNGMSMVFQQMVDQGMLGSSVFGIYINRYSCMSKLLCATA